MAQQFKPYANTLARGSLAALGLLPVVGFYAGSTISRSGANTKAGVALNQPIPFSHKHHVGELGIDCRFCHVDVEKGKTSSIPPVKTCMTCHSQIWTNSPLLEPAREAYENDTPIQFTLTDEVGWNQVNKLPAFVYFNHSIHIDRGINCNQCHGPIQEMQMTYKNHAFSMAWCLECHREPEKFLFEDPDQPAQTPNQKVFDLYRKMHDGAKLTPREEAIRDGKAYSPSQEEINKGKALAEAMKIKSKQLTDCWTCHR